MQNCKEIIPWNRVLKNLIKKTHAFLETRGSSVYSQRPANGSYLEPLQSNPHLHILFQQDSDLLTTLPSAPTLSKLSLSLRFSDQRFVLENTRGPNWSLVLVLLKSKPIFVTAASRWECIFTANNVMIRELHPRRDKRTRLN